jgi:hypothetical protein
MRHNLRDRRPGDCQVVPLQNDFNWRYGCLDLPGFVDDLPDVWIVATADLAEYLQAEVKRRWPEERFPFHIEVIGDAISRRMEVRVWNRDGVDVVMHASPDAFLSTREKSPTVAAVFEAVELAVAEAQDPGPPKADAHHA